MAHLHAIRLQAQPIATPIPRSVQSFVARACITAMTAAIGGALVVVGLLLAVLAVPLAPIALVWVLVRQRRLDRTWTLRPAGT